MTVTDRFSGSALRLLAVLGALAMVVALLPQTAGAQAPDPADACPQDAPASGFTDRDEIPAVHVNNVDCAAHLGIVQGFADNTYRPRLQVRRDQMASFIALTLDAAGVTLPAGEGDTFTDVGSGNVHAGNINRLAAAGIVEGAPLNLGPDEYGPALRTRRDQMTSFLMRAAGFALHGDVNAFDSTAQAFSDVPAGNVHFAKVNAAAEHGITLGTGGGLFSPRLETRRDQMASFVIRLLWFILEGDVVVPAPGLSLALDPVDCEVGQDITVTATATGADGESAGDGIEVTFEASIDGGATETTTETTDVAGVATATYTPESAGDLTITVSATVEDTEVSDTVTIECPEPPTPNPALPGATTFAPEMTGAEIVATTDDNIVVTYTFDENVQTAPTAANFRIYTFNAGPALIAPQPTQGFSGTSRQILGNTVRVTFDQVRGNEASYFTVATTNFGAVTNSDGLPSPEADAPLFGAHVSGFTQAPDLVDVEFRPATNEVNFVYDEPVAIAPILAFQHILVDINNNLVSAVSANRHPTRPNVVEAQFALITTNTEATTARAVTGTGGVQDLDGRLNNADAIAVCCDGRTNAPDLVDVTLNETDFEARFRFTEPVTINNPFGFLLLHFDTTITGSIGAFVDPSDTSVVVAQYNPGQVERAVRAAVNFGTVQGVGGINPLNSLDIVRLTDRTFVGGITNAPDLLDAFVQLGSVGGVGTTRVVYDFDQTVHPIVSAGFFFVYDLLGNRFTATNCARQINDLSRVQCVFAGATVASDNIISEARLATVDNNETNNFGRAVRDVNILFRNNPEGASVLRHP